MTTGNTTLLGLALPVEGELDGTWGDVVNDSITSLVDSAVAGTTTLSTDADVTLTSTVLAANQARQAVILWTASNGGTPRNITAPARSKPYIVINAGTGSAVLRGAGPTTGITIVSGERCLAAWNGSDFVKVSTSVADGVTSVGGTGTVNGITLTGTVTSTGNLTLGGALTGVNLTTQVTGTLPVANGGTGATTLTANNVIIGNGTSAPLFVAPGTSGNVLTSNGTTWTSSAGASVSAATPLALGTVYGRTPGSSADGVHLGYNSGTNFSGTNSVGIGPSVLASASYTGTQNIAIGWTSMTGTTSGSYSVGVGWGALSAMTTGNFNVGMGRVALYSLTTGSSNVGIGNGALQTLTVASNNTAVGNNALNANTSGAQNVAVGMNASVANTTGNNRVAIGYGAMQSATTLSGSVAIGYNAAGNYTGSNNFVAIGAEAFSNSGGMPESVGVGANVGSSMTSGQWNVFVGHSAGTSRVSGDNNVFIGYLSGAGSSASGAENVGVGHRTLATATTGAGNTAVGANASELTTTGSDNTYIGQWAGRSLTTGTQNVFVGKFAGLPGGSSNLTTGSNNILIGYNAAASSATVSNENTFGNSSTTSNRFFGDMKMAGTTSGTSGQVLTSSGAGVAPTWAAASSGALVLLSTVTASASATVDVETGFSSTYDDYMITVSGVISSTASSTLLGRLKLGGAYNTTGMYYWNTLTRQTSSTTYGAEAAQGDTSLQLSAAASLATGLGDNFSMSMFLLSVNNAGTKSIYSNGAYGLYNNKGGGTLGYANSTSVLSGVRFFASTGNLTGTFKLYGIAK